MELDQTIIKKRESEKQLITLMIEIYCKGNKHQKGICDDCQTLIQYSHERIERCPYMETKTFCSKCKTHCYKLDMREKIRTVMRYAGPRMMLHHPIIAIRHVIEEKRK
ncbi:MAG: nitrous oxide-stimulated promoter family protein [Coprobacillaceae bacterium]